MQEHPLNTGYYQLTIRHTRWFTHVVTYPIIKEEVSAVFLR